MDRSEKIKNLNNPANKMLLGINTINYESITIFIAVAVATATAVVRYLYVVVRHLIGVARNR